MTCREFHEFLLDYSSGTLPDEERAVFERHLAVCPSCVAYLQSYQETVKLSKGAFSLEDSDLPPDPPEELVRAVLAARRQGS